MVNLMHDEHCLRIFSRIVFRQLFSMVDFDISMNGMKISGEKSAN
jgi:hypothetical protein